MKLAIAHDWLNQKKGGGERVLFTLARAYPKAPIFTLIFNRAKFADEIDPSRIKTSFLQWLPRALKHRARYLLPLIPAATRSLSFRDYDVVLSSSFAFIKNITVPKKTLHICYCHTPMRFAWDYRDQYMAEQRVGALQRTIGAGLRELIKQWDRRGSRRVDLFIANSETVASRIKRYYNREAIVINPPVELERFAPGEKGDYCITMSMLTPYKKIDLVIKAFNKSGRRLVILGEGPERGRLEALAEQNIEFKGYVSDTEKARLLSGAQALIFPNKEDFGIAMVEALASGTPVVAYAKGGATEILTPETGLLFSKQTPAALNQALEKLDKRNFKTTELTKRASNFSEAKFIQAINKTVKEQYRAHVQAD